MKLQETNWNRYLRQLSNIGFVVLSACLGDDEQSDMKNTKEFQKILVESDFAFKPVDGLYTYKPTGEFELKTSAEKSFLITSFDKRNHKVSEFNKLYDFAIKYGKKYEQQSVLICKPHENPYYLYLKNMSSDKPFNKITFDDFNTRYGTADRKGSIVWNSTDDGKLKKIKRSFTLFNGKRPVRPKDPDNIDFIDYTDKEKEDAKMKGIDLEKEHAFLEVLSSSK